MKQYENEKVTWLEGTVFIFKEDEGKICISFYRDKDCKYFDGAIHVTDRTIHIDVMLLNEFAKLGVDIRADKFKP